MKILATGIFIFFATQSFSQQDSSFIKLSNPVSIHAPKGYSHVAEINLGTCRMLIISGQVALDKQGNLVGKDDISKQAEQIFQNLKACVESAGGNMNSIVKLGYFIKDITQIQKVRDVRDKFINVSKPPASTLVEVSKLFRDDILLEVEAVAVIRN